MSDNMIIGAIEACDLPDIGLTNLEVRVDTGAKTSSLHVDNIALVEKDGEEWVSFDIHPDAHDVDKVVNCVAELQDVRTIKSSSGCKQRRYIIRTHILLGGRTWPINLTLSNRADMTYLMLLGREAMQDEILVNPGRIFLCTNRKKQTEH